MVLTAAYYKDGGIYIDVYNGRTSTSSSQQLSSSSPSFTFSDPDATYPDKGEIIEIGHGQTKTINPYVILDDNGVAEGKFAINGEPSVNTLRVKQNIVFDDLGRLNNEGSAGMHFTDGDIIYYGGGIVKHESLGYEQTVPSYEFRSYNTKTGEETAYADIPESGAGAIWGGKPVIVGAQGLYILDGRQWHTAATRTSAALAATVEGDKLYVVTGSMIETYTLGTDGNGNPAANHEGAEEHGEYFGTVNITHDGDGTTWLMDNLMHKAYAVKGGALEATDCTPADTLNP